MWIRALFRSYSAISWPVPTNFAFFWRTFWRIFDCFGHLFQDSKSIGKWRLEFSAFLELGTKQKKIALMCIQAFTSRHRKLLCMAGAVVSKLTCVPCLPVYQSWRGSSVFFQLCLKQPYSEVAQCNSRWRLANRFHTSPLYRGTDTQPRNLPSSDVCACIVLTRVFVGAFGVFRSFGGSKTETFSNDSNANKRSNFYIPRQISDSLDTFPIDFHDFSKFSRKSRLLRNLWSF